MIFQIVQFAKLLFNLRYFSLKDISNIVPSNFIRYNAVKDKNAWVKLTSKIKYKIARIWCILF